MPINGVIAYILIYLSHLQLLLDQQNPYVPNSFENMAMIIFAICCMVSLLPKHAYMTDPNFPLIVQSGFGIPH